MTVVLRFHGSNRGSTVPRFQSGRFRGFQRFRAGYGSVLHFSTRIRHVLSIGSCRFRTGPCLDGSGRLKTRFGACRFSRFGPFGHLYLERVVDRDAVACMLFMWLFCFEKTKAHLCSFFNNIIRYELAEKILLDFPVTCIFIFPIIFK